jgi:hypothetical protein
MKRALSVTAVIMASAMIFSGCSSDNSPEEATASPTSVTTLPSIGEGSEAGVKAGVQNGTEVGADAGVDAGVATPAPTEPAPPAETAAPAPEMTVEQTLAQMYEDTFMDILRVSPTAYTQFEAYGEYLETEGQRRWEAANPGGVFLPDSGALSFSDEEDMNLREEYWLTEDFLSAFDNISFMYWGDGAYPGMWFMTTVIYHVQQMRPDLHDYQIEVPEEAFQIGNADNEYMLDISQVVITRDGQQVPLEFGFIAIFTNVDGEWKMTPESGSADLFPFEDLAV